MVTPRVVRYAGLTGSVLVTVGSHLGGAGFTRRPVAHLVPFFRGDRGVLLPVCWTIGLALLLAAWWTGRRLVPSVRWAVVTVSLWVLPLLASVPLGSEDAYSYACQGWVQQAGGDPYGSGAAGCPWLASVSTTWRDAPAPYGPLFLLVAGAAVRLGGGLAGALAGLRAAALTGVALIAVAVPALARRAGVDPGRALWLAVAGPLVLVHLVSGLHNDALMMGLLLAGLAVAASGGPGRLVAGGLLIGAAADVKATAAVALPFAVLAALPAGSPLRSLWRPAVPLLGGAVLASGALSLLAGHGLGWVNGLLRSGDTVEWTSPSTAVGIVVGRLAGVDAVPVTRVIGTLLLVPVLIALWWWARRHDALLGAGLALAATVLLAPVFHPWYALWPLAVLAATVRRDTRWLTVPCAVASVLCLPDGYNVALGTRIQGAVLMTAGIVVAAVAAARRRVSSPA